MSNRAGDNLPFPSGTSRERSYTTVFLNLFTFEIDIWGRLRRATESARAQLLAEDWNRKTVITTLISDVATAYFNLLELDMELAIAKNTLVTRQESLRLIKVQQQGGVATLLDVRQGEQLVYSAAESIPNCRAANRANRKSNKFAAGQKSRSHNTKPSTNRATNTARSAGRFALIPLGETSRHPGSGADSGCRQR